MMLRLCLVLALVGACDQDAGETTPEEQELARINRELAALKQTVDSLHARVDRVESDRVESAGRAQEPEVAEPDTLAVVLSVDPANAQKLMATIDGRQVAADELLAGIEPHKERAMKAGVVLVASANASHGQVVGILDRLREAGIQRIAIQIEEAGSP